MFKNSVHEPGPNGDSETILSRKPGKKKTEPGARAPSRPNWHAQVCTGASRRAHGRRIVAESPAVLWQGADRVAGPSGRVVGARPATSCLTPLRALPRAPSRHAVRVAGLHGRIVSTVPRASAVSGPGLPAVSRHSFLPSSLFGHNTPRCIATRKPSCQPFLCHDTLCVLRYNFS